MNSLPSEKASSFTALWRTLSSNRIVTFLFTANRFPNKYWSFGIIIPYIILTVALIFKHEPWFDEAQSWLLARDANFFDLITKYLRYEGSPGFGIYY